MRAVGCVWFCCLLLLFGAVGCCWYVGIEGGCCGWLFLLFVAVGVDRCCCLSLLIVVVVCRCCPLFVNR